MISFRTKVEWSATSAAVTRHAVTEWLDAVPCAADVKRDMVLLASELVTGVLNACTAPPVLEGAFDEQRLRLQVVSSEVVGPPGDLLPAGGLGSVVVDAVCDVWGVETTPTSTLVWAERRC